jgi:hypothetical protein
MSQTTFLLTLFEQLASTTQEAIAARSRPQHPFHILFLSRVRARSAARQFLCAAPPNPSKSIIGKRGGSRRLALTRPVEHALQRSHRNP